MAKKIGLVNNKGGSTKTTTSVNIAGGILKFKPEARILLVDDDGQGNATRSFKLQPNKMKETIYNVFMGEKEVEEVIIKDVYEGIDMIPANAEMNFFEFDKMKIYEDELAAKTFDLVKMLDEKNVDIKSLTLSDWESLVNNESSMTENYFNLLNGKFDSLEDEYDYIIFDTPPEIKSVTSSILSICDSVIIPFEPDLYSVEGIVNIVDRIEIIKEKYNPKLTIAGLLAVKVNARTNIHNEVQAKVFRYASLNDIPFFGTFIPSTIKFASSTIYSGLPATLSNTKKAKTDKMTQSYFDLVEEMILKNVI